MNDEQDVQHNGSCMSVCLCGHSNLVIYYLISSEFHIWTTFIKLLFKSGYGFYLMNENQDGRKNSYPLFTTGHYAALFVGV